MAPSSIIIAALAAAVVGLASLVVYLGRGWRNAAARVAVGHTIIDRQQAEIAAANDAVRMAQGRVVDAERRIGRNRAAADMLLMRAGELSDALAIARAQLAEQAPFVDKGRKLVARRKAQDAARKLGRAK